MFEKYTIGNRKQFEPQPQIECYHLFPGGKEMRRGSSVIIKSGLGFGHQGFVSDFVKIKGDYRIYVVVDLGSIGCYVVSPDDLTLNDSQPTEKASPTAIRIDGRKYPILSIEALYGGGHNHCTLTLGNLVGITGRNVSGRLKHFVRDMYNGECLGLIEIDRSDNKCLAPVTKLYHVPDLREELTCMGLLGPERPLFSERHGLTGPGKAEDDEQINIHIEVPDYPLNFNL